MFSQLILEILVAILLGLTIGYCIILNRRLAIMRDSQGEMQKIVRLLNEAVNRAALSVEDMRRHAQSVSEELNGKIKSGRAIVDELGLMVQSGNNIADRLASGSSERPVNGKKQAQRKTPQDSLRRTLAVSGIEAADPRSSEHGVQAKRELRQALETMR